MRERASDSLGAWVKMVETTRVSTNCKGKSDIWSVILESLQELVVFDPNFIQFKDKVSNYTEKKSQLTANELATSKTLH